MPRKNFKSSSYDRVADVLQAFPEWQAVVPAALESLNGLKVKNAVFNKDTTYDGNLRQSVVVAVANFVVVNAADEEAFRIPENIVLEGSAEHVPLELDAHIPTALIENVVSKYFATPLCPTFNCKKDKVLAKLVDRVKETVKETHKAHINATRERLFNFCVTAQKSEEFQQKKGRTYDVAVIAEVKKIFHVYANKVGPDVLKEAWREYVAEDIMEA